MRRSDLVEQLVQIVPTLGTMNLSRGTDTCRMRLLNFDITDSSDGILTLEAMASTREAGHAAVMKEVEEVIAWAQDVFGGREGPVEDGYAWDHELLVQREAGGWVTVTLTFSASAEFAEAFRAVFVSTEGEA